MEVGLGYEGRRRANLARYHENMVNPQFTPNE